MRRLLTVLIAVTFTVFAKEPAQPWFDVWTAESAPTFEQAEALAAAAFASTDGDAVLPADASDTAPRLFFVTTREPDRIVTRFCSGHGFSAAADHCSGNFNDAAFGARVIRVDIVTSVEPERLHAPEFAPGLNPAVWGLALPAANLGAILPGQLVAAGLLTESGDLDREAWLAFAARRGADMDALAFAFTHTPLDVYRFQTIAFAMDDGLHVVPQERIYPESLTDAVLMNAAVAAGNYLTRAVEADGRFVYRYDAVRDTVADDYNILRHAGTTFSMLELYRRTGNDWLLEAAERALEYLAAQVERCSAPVSGAQAGCLTEFTEVKLGGAGLALLAFAEHAVTTNSDRFLDTMRLLGEWIVGAQYPDGRWVHKLEDGEITDFESLYYPGEAIYGMMRLYAVDPDPRWLASARAGADYIMLVRDIDTPDSELEHDHWLLYGLDVLHRADPQPHDLVHLRRLVLEIVRDQHREDVPLEWIGGYGVPPRSTPTATRSEGLCAAARLLRDRGDTGLAALLENSVALGVTFQLQTQIAGDAALYANPQFARGGFRGELLSGEIRIDYVQHSLSSILCLRELVFSP